MKLFQKVFYHASREGLKQYKIVPTDRPKNGLPGELTFKMDLKALGFSDWFSDYSKSLLQPEREFARVVAVDRNVYLVRGESKEISSELSGRFRFAVEISPDLPCVGDWVSIQQASSELAIIHGVVPRKSFLRRKTPGNTVGFQMIAANIDAAFVVQSCQHDFNIRRLDRYLVACSEGGIEPVIILSKTDLLSQEEVDGLICDLRCSGITAQIVPVSSTKGIGLERFRELLEPGKTYCFVGSSGVGKSTLINRAMGRDELETKAVSATGEGTYTTSRRQLLVLDNGTMLIDTPGMRELGLMGASEGLYETFSDIKELSLRCRFANCIHRQEPGCAVLEAIIAHELSEGRYQSYLKLEREIEHHNISYVEKRKKDRDFGRHVKSVMKHKKR